MKAFLFRLARNVAGQDLTEYALMAGFVAVAAGAIMPNVSVYVSAVFSNITSTLTNAAS
jgi:pilus assembly protein Flp/PilA